MVMEQWNTNQSNHASVDRKEKALVWVLFLERWIVLPFFIYILVHWKKQKAGWPRLQFNMIVLGDILRMIILFIQCILQLWTTHDNPHLNGISFYINNLSHAWRDIWEVIVVVVIFKYLMMPFNNRIQFKMRYMIIVSTVYVAVVGILLDWYYTTKILSDGTMYQQNNRFGYSLKCIQEGSIKRKFDRVIYSAFMTAITVAFLLIWMAAMIIGLQFRKMKLWFECHHMNQLLLIIGLFAFFTFPPKLFQLISTFDSSVLKSKHCNDILLTINLVSSTRVLLDIYMWKLCAKFQTSIDYDVDITTNCSADKRCYNSTASLLSSSSQTTEAEKIYPNAEEYFKNRIISFMRTTIVGLLKNKLESDLSQELTQFKRIKLQKTNIECTEVYPRHFEILRQDVWKIDSKGYIDSFERGFGKEQINFGNEGSVFFLTEDQKYIIKSLSRREYRYLLKIFQEYYNFNHANKRSCLIRFLGLFRVRVMKFQPMINIIIIENIAHQNNAYSSKIYNIMMNPAADESQYCQSSTWGGHVVLPRDFSHLIVTESRDTSHIQDCLKKDLKFLENNNCIDYKLLAVEYDVSSSNRMDRGYKSNQFAGVQVVDGKVVSAVKLYKFYFINITTPHYKWTDKILGRSRKVKVYAEPFMVSIKELISNNYHDDCDTDDQE